MTTTREFRVKRASKRLLWLDVKVYATRAELQRAANDWERRRNVHPDFAAAEHTLACVQQNLGPSPLVGTMRLSEEDLTPEVVIHESLHAAHKFVCKERGVSTLRLPDRGGEPEEDLAYAVGEIAAMLLTNLIPSTKG